MKTKKGREIPLTVCFLALASMVSDARETRFDPGEMRKWKVAGIGRLVLDEQEQAARLEEGINSKGVTFLSPAVFGGDVVVRFRVKPLTSRGVNIVFLSLAANGKAGPISSPEGYDGNLDFWTQGGISGFMAAFHTGFHQPNSWIKKNPGGQSLAESPDIAVGEKWFAVEFGKKGEKLWLAVDEKSACEGVDPDHNTTPAGGFIGLRLRGAGDGTYACLIKDLVVID